jgi:MauM/NapG family ferredoxin protein
MRNLRIISQTVFFILFSLTFFLFTNQARGYAFESEWFLWLNPLSSILASIASRHFIIPALIVGLSMLLATIVLGRFFCGWICPLGSIIDFSDKYVAAKIYSRLRIPPAYIQRLKYIILISLTVLALFGALLPLFMDPISLATRFFALILNTFASVFTYDIQQAIKPLLLQIGLMDLAYKNIHVPVYYGIFLATGLFVLILGLGFWDKRFWCQYVCPSGALFCLLSRFAVLRRNVPAEKCSACKRCERVCPTHAISLKEPRFTSVAECILCGKCMLEDKICTNFTFTKFSKIESIKADVQRRHILAGFIGGLLLVPAFKANAWNKRDNTGRMIRPPGSVPEEEFLSRCITCGACMKACPTNTIQPCSIDDGLNRINTPKIVARVAGCEEKCHLCGYVCPTGAIRPLSYDDKQFAKIGTAVIDQHRCLAWSQNKECLVCDEVCPYNAIEPKVVETTKGKFKVPVVYEDVCIGCGMCEQQCPITDQAAIVVYKFGENRISHGPYLSDSQKKAMLDRRKQSDSNPSASAGAAGPAPAEPYSSSTQSSSGSMPAFLP